VKTLRDVRDLKRVRKPVVLAVGFFDGLHRGHRKVIEKALARARQIGGETWVLTFDAHPLKVLAPRRAPLLLTSVEHKMRMLEQMGIDGCLVVRFTRRLARQKPEEFVAKLCEGAPSLAWILVGGNWRFGRGGQGDAPLLARFGRQRGFGVTVVRPVLHQGLPISSTRIRREIMRGRLDEAAAMLGRRFSIMGTVTHGRRVGRKLGYRTANLWLRNEVMPPPGVYAVRARVRGRLRDGVLNFGYRPTFGKKPARPAMELHLFDFAGSLYREVIQVCFVKRLRSERKFRSVRDLQSRIAEDIRNARRCLLSSRGSTKRDIRRAGQA
jgi:riboflavin kinase / FMN adenylyltransferase